MSHYKNLVVGYPKTSFLSLESLGYPGISCMSSYPGISQYRLGFGRVLFFQMQLRLAAWPEQLLGLQLAYKFSWA